MRRVLILLLILLPVQARADIVLDPMELNESLKRIARWKGEIEKAPDSEAALEALVSIGKEADELARTFNREIESHGRANAQLIDLAIDRLKKLGVNIGYHQGKSLYYYDCAAYIEYLKQAPQGKGAADARFGLIDYKFFQSMGNNVKELLDAAAEKQKFLKDYPDYAMNPRVILYLGIDYRDLFRLYSRQGERAAAARYRRLAMDAFKRVIARYPESEEASSASYIMSKLETER